MEFFRSFLYVYLMRIPSVSLICSLLACLHFAFAESTNDKIKVGAILPLSGPIASWGEPIRTGLEVSNEILGSPFTLIFEDEGACEAQKTVRSYRKLVDIDSVHLIFVGCLAGIKAVAPMAKDRDVLLLSLGMLDDASVGSAKIVNLAAQLGDEGRVLAKYVAKEKPSLVAGIFFADSFGQEFARGLSQSLNEMGYPLAFSEEAQVGVDSFKSIITRWKHKGVDLVITSLSDRQSLTLIKEMQALEFHPKIYSSSVLESVMPTKDQLHLFNGVNYVYGTNESGEPELKQRIESAVSKRLKPDQLLNLNTFFAYDGMRFLLDGLKTCKSADTTCLFKSFGALGQQKGVSGTFTLAPSGSISRPYILKGVREGRYTVLVETI